MISFQRIVTIQEFFFFFLIPLLLEKFESMEFLFVLPRGRRGAPRERGKFFPTQVGRSREGERGGGGGGMVGNGPFFEALIKPDDV